MCVAIASLTLVCVVMLTGIMVPMNDEGGAVTARMSEVPCGAADSATRPQPPFAQFDIVVVSNLDVARPPRAGRTVQTNAVATPSPPHLESSPLRT